MPRKSTKSTAYIARLYRQLEAQHEESLSLLTIDGVTYPSDEFLASANKYHSIAREILAVTGLDPRPAS